VWVAVWLRVVVWVRVAVWVRMWVHMQVLELVMALVPVLYYHPLSLPSPRLLKAWPGSGTTRVLLCKWPQNLLLELT
jgi:hypothetical protein